MHCQHLLLFYQGFTQEHFFKTEITVYNKTLITFPSQNQIKSPCHLHSYSNKGIAHVEHSNTSWKSHALPSVNSNNTIIIYFSI